MEIVKKGIDFLGIQSLFLSNVHPQLVSLALLLRTSFDKMRYMIRHLDHLVLAVRDLSAAQTFFQGLGFQTAPRGIHPFGTGNHNVFFDRSFIELLGVLDPEKIPTISDEQQFGFATFNQSFLTKRQGVSMLVVSTLDARADEERLKRGGWQTYPSFHFSRPQILADGQKTEVAFTSTFCTHPLLPDLAFFVCQHHHPEYIWQAAYQKHDNQVRQIAAIDLVTDPDSRIVALLQHLFDHPTNHQPFLQVANTRINYLSPAAFHAQYGTAAQGFSPPAIGALHFELPQQAWEKLATVLQKNNTAFVLRSQEIILSPDEAFGVFLCFHLSAKTE